MSAAGGNSASQSSSTRIPPATGIVRLTFATDDGLVRWRVETEGWEIIFLNEEGPAAQPDVTRQDRLAALPANADELVRRLADQFEGRAEISISSTSPGAEAQAALAERQGRVAANRARYLAQLRASAPDLEPALAAMRAQIAEQFGSR